MKLILDFAASRIGIEGDGEELLTVLRLAREIAPSLAHIEIHTAARALEVPKSPQKQGVSASHENRNIGSNGGGVSSGQTLRQFVRTLKLDSIPERIAAVAYYKKTYENVESFSPKEMSAWFSVCAVSEALADAGGDFQCRQKPRLRGQHWAREMATDDQRRELGDRQAKRQRHSRNCELKKERAGGAVSATSP